MCFDAKFNFDDSAKFRQRDVFAMDDESESDPREVEAGKHALNYISLDGDIACLGKKTLIQVFKSLYFICSCIVFKKTNKTKQKNGGIFVGKCSAFSSKWLQGKGYQKLNFARF